MLLQHESHLNVTKVSTTAKAISFKSDTNSDALRILYMHGCEKSTFVNNTIHPYEQNFVDQSGNISQLLRTKDGKYYLHLNITTWENE